MKIEGILELREAFIQSPFESGGDAPPARYLRHKFRCEKAIRSATLRYAAFGLLEPWLNGCRLNDDRFLPGWSDYRKRLYWIEESVTEQLKPGDNTLGFVVANGWAGVHYGPWPTTQCLVDTISVSVILEIVYTDSTSEIIRSSPDWLWAKGPVSSQALYHGETYDARKELVDWLTPDCDKRRWRPGCAVVCPDVTFSRRKAPPVRVIEELAPQRIWKRSERRYIVDFGQNLVGVVKLRLNESSGTKVRLRFGEMLESSGELYTENLRSARSTDVYYCKGVEGETLAPRWTFHGFRYVEIEGLSLPPDLSHMNAQVLHNDLEPIGRFKTSHPLIDQLQSCIVWGQRGNFLEVPTDCPQRDERLGWSGDAQVFVKTACFNYDCNDFYRQWMDAMRDGQRADGAFPDLAPDVLGWHGNPGWGDAGIIVPYSVWQCYGDTRIVEENWEAMLQYLNFLKGNQGEGRIEPEVIYGDWLAVDAARPQWGPTPKDLIADAYHAHVVHLMSEMAHLLGHKKKHHELVVHRKKLQKQFQDRYITRAGLILGDTQASYLHALAFDLVPSNLVQKSADRLIEKIKERDWHLSTGFLGTPLLNPVLSKVGRSEVAYQILEQETYPSWLYPIVNGATTMWERWNSWTRTDGFGPVDMNSFNHYAYGAIGEWLYQHLAGLEVRNAFDQPRVRLTPKPGGTVKQASAEMKTKFGKVKIQWKLNTKRFSLNVMIPKGVSASLVMPVLAHDSIVVKQGSVEDIEKVLSSVDGQNPAYSLMPGRYEFSVPVDAIQLAKEKNTCY
ncbi:family 78 glycoside hydrolase catalytic domain [Coraliomargarita sp. SDUM461004]|uniref:alpha-L-rhamnosidase n=1 Tax=Thalassobacterium sedimentorum TaxID=3041258 RepID=A0ABU1AGE7_9BACT|nr:family 78 glycoside hydrolase catalytic domain [Coraliomargarita sp. SDUM461004]MDQ8193860.1 family 78 glycoside hydrolase catalytic domain [Coraliomargarita sp. SDUM461004]